MKLYKLTAQCTANFVPLVAPEKNVKQEKNFALLFISVDVNSYTQWYGLLEDSKYLETNTPGPTTNLIQIYCEDCEEEGQHVRHPKHTGRIL